MHEGFCLYLDPGFIVGTDIELADDARTFRRADYPNPLVNKVYALDSYNQERYRRAKRERTVATFRAVGRHGKEPVLQVHNDIEVVCPEPGHGRQTISLERIGAISLPAIGRALQRALGRGGG